MNDTEILLVLECTLSLDSKLEFVNDREVKERFLAYVQKFSDSDCELEDINVVHSETNERLLEPPDDTYNDS